MTIINNLDDINHLINKNFSIQEVFNRVVKYQTGIIIDTVNDIDLVEITMNENVNAFDIVTVDGYKANSNTIAQRNKIAGIALENINNGFSGIVRRRGKVTNGLWSFTTGDKLFLNGTSLSLTMPNTGYVLELGKMLSLTELDFNFDYGILRG